MTLRDLIDPLRFALRWTKRWGPGVLLFCLPACGYVGLDLSGLYDETSAIEGAAGGDQLSKENTTEGAAEVEADGLGGETASGRPATGGAEASGGSGVVGSGGGGVIGSGGSGELLFPTYEACADTESIQFDFDSSASWTDGSPTAGRWGIDRVNTQNSGELTWTSERGHFAAGALQLIILDPESELARQVLFPKTLVDVKDLRAARLVVHVFLDSGVDVTAKLFLQSVQSGSWSNGPEVLLSAGAWSCVGLDVQEPSFANSEFDPSQVTVMGVEAGRAVSTAEKEPLFVYLDDLSLRMNE